MTPEAIFKRLQDKFGAETVFDYHADKNKDRDPWFQVAPWEIEKVAEHLRHDADLAFDYLECITGVDYPDLKKIVVVYHVYSYDKKHRVVLKAFLDREDPAMPTLVNVWSVANWQERECFDLLGVIFEGHPDLRRLLLPDDWEGYPLRKDYEEKEDYHGIPTIRPNPIELFKIGIPGERRGEVMSEVVFTNEMDEEMTLNMGPHHPSTHGVLRFIVQSDGEIIRKAIPDVGYLHRAIEKIGERCTYPGYMPYTDRVDYLAAMFANEVWAAACEKLMGIEVPKRAQYLRVISCELNRIASHMIAIGAMAMDIGAVTPFPLALAQREAVNDLIEELCGARLTYNYHRIGGVSFDMPKGWSDKVLAWLDRYDPFMNEWDRLITGNDIFIKRLASVGVITAEEAKDWGLVGPNLRASGVKWDLRKDDAYSVYPELDFDVPIGKGEHGTVGDSWDRFWVRGEECRESSKILRQALVKIDEHPEDDIVGKLPKKMKPDGEAYARIEAARGDMGCYVVGKGAEEPYRARFRTGSFNAMGIIEAKSPGLFLADLVALIGSFDVVAPEIDR